ncbi:MAG: glycerol-3-phosphate dehydrogenase [NAD(P)+] [Leptospiraceae bacterium]|nr:MAG: glycerol-3-phosphate dehydrogenase [NAD(P)+] [Leptospiraceae bacterium]
MKVSVLGAGSFGTALANVLGDKGYNVYLYARRKELVDSINQNQENIEYLKGYKLSENIKATNHLEECLQNTKMIVLAIPTQNLSKFINEYRYLFPENIPIVCVAKGIEEHTLRLVSEILEEELPGKYQKYLCYLSGPSFAKEIIQRIPTLVSIASKNEEIAKQVQQYFYTSYFRTYWLDDVIGVEIGGALKNVIAIACGVSDGLGLGHNTRAALITRGLAEIQRLGVKKGANPMTFLGLTGLGDLVLTCTGELSRNRTVGFQLGKGKKLDEIIKELHQVAEGVYTARSAYDLSKKFDIEMPITESVYKMLYENIPPNEIVKKLMQRELKKEF